MLAAAFSENPYQEYDRIRDYSPCFYDKLTNSYIVSGYHEVSHIINQTPYLSSYRIWEEKEPATPAAFSSGNPFGTFGSVPPYMAGPEELVPIIEKNVNTLLSRIRGSLRFDIVRQFSSLISFGVFADLTGLSRTDIPRFQHWYSTYKEAIVNLEKNPDVAVTCENSRTEMAKYLDRVSAHGVPGESVVKWTELGDSRDEIIGTLLLLGGMHFDEAFARYMLMLSRSENGRLSNLLKDDHIALEALKETYRCYTPQPVVAIRNQQDIALGNLNIPRNSQINLLISAANRDPSVFPMGDSHQTTVFSEEQVFTGYHQPLLSSGYAYQLYAARLSNLMAITASRAIFSSMGSLRFLPEENWVFRQSLIAEVVKA